MSLRVLIQTRVDAYEKYGGDVVHAEKVRDALQERGVDATLSTETEIDLSDYDLVHIFNMDWVRDPYLQILNAQKQGKPIVLTPIHHSFSEIDRFEKEMRYGLRRLINPIFPRYIQREYLKNIYRAFVNIDTRKWYGTVVQWRVGLRRQYEEVLSMATLVLPNTALELEELKNEFHSTFHAKIVPAGVELGFKSASSEWFEKEYPEISRSFSAPFVLVVGRIEPRKNQLKILEALEGVSAPILLIGQFNTNHPEYTWRVKRAIATRGATIKHIERVPYEHMGSLFAACHAHVLASWFETTGLVSLEAGLTGAQVVAPSTGFGSEYLGEHAFYVDPSDTHSIRSAILGALESPRENKALIERIEEKYTWDKVGEMTEQAYRHVLGEEKD